MKKFLKITAIVMVIAMLAAFASCGGNGGEKEKLVMATNAEFPPYEYVEDGKIVGIDAEIAALIAEKLDM